jgi:hypothetical protein
MPAYGINHIGAQIDHQGNHKSLPMISDIANKNGSHGIALVSLLPPDASDFFPARPKPFFGSLHPIQTD